MLLGLPAGALVDRYDRAALRSRWARPRAQRGPALPRGDGRPRLAVAALRGGARAGICETVYDQRGDLDGADGRRPRPAGGGEPTPAKCRSRRAELRRSATSERRLRARGRAAAFGVSVATFPLAALATCGGGGSRHRRQRFKSSRDLVRLSPGEIGRLLAHLATTLVPQAFRLAWSHYRGNGRPRPAFATTNDNRQKYRHTSL